MPRPSGSPNGRGSRSPARSTGWSSTPGARRGRSELPCARSGVRRHFGRGSGTHRRAVRPRGDAGIWGVTMDELILHEDPRSGNCYKIRLTGALLGLPLVRREYDILKGETRTPEFLAKVNANGRIPVLQVGQRLLPESNAACFYLAEGSKLIPADRFERADMLRWMFFEQYNHEPNIATLRFWMRSIGLDNLSDPQRLQMPAKRQA